MEETKLIILLLIISYMNCKILRLQECNKYHAEFSILYHRKKLNNSVFISVNDADFTKCSIICLNHPTCKSISFKDNGSMCLIHDNSINDGDDVQLLNDDGWLHAETPENARNAGPVCNTIKPCQHGKCKDECSGRGYHCTCDGRWVLQAKNVCYGAKGNKNGEFIISSDGVLIKVKLVHVKGQLSCYGDHESYFGCINKSGTVITTKEKDWVLPPSKTTHNGYYTLADFTDQTTELILSGYNKSVNKGDTLSIWFVEDLLDQNEGDNSGIHCIDVYAMFCDEE